MERDHDQRRFGQARHEIDTLFWKDFCDHYIEIAKERLYQPEELYRKSEMDIKACTGAAKILLQALVM